MSQWNGQTHPAAALFPYVDEHELRDLADDIASKGLQEPIVLMADGTLLDGRNRLRACGLAGVEPRFDVYDGSDPIGVIVSRNLRRRHLSTGQRAALAAELLPFYEQGARQRQVDEGRRSTRTDLRPPDETLVADLQQGSQWDSKAVSRAAGQVGTSGRAVAQYKRVAAEAPELAEQVRAGKVALDNAHRQVAAASRRAEVAAMDGIESGDEAGAILANVPDEADPDALRDAVAECVESKRTPMPVPKNTAALGGVAHPARYSSELLPVFARLLAGASTVLDPFAGTGRIHELAGFGFATTGIELEPEWARLHPATMVGDATALPFEAESFDAICTSPTYGNRLADSHNAYDPESRRSYTHDLGRKLNPNNSGAMHWGDAYRAFHGRAWVEALRVLRPGGLFVLNIKDHIRGGQRQYVAGWHVTALARLGATLLAHEEVATATLRAGANADLRMAEQVYLLRKEG